MGYRIEEKLKNQVFESSSSIYILGINPWWDEGAVTVYHHITQPKVQIREEHIDLPNTHRPNLGPVPTTYLLRCFLKAQSSCCSQKDLHWMLGRPKPHRSTTLSRCDASNATWESRSEAGAKPRALPSRSLCDLGQMANLYLSSCNKTECYNMLYSWQPN